MRALTRWQDWVTMALGIIVFASPFFFNATGHTAAAWTSYAAGVIIFFGGALAAASEEPGPFEAIPVIFGMVLIAAPWLLSFTDVTGVAWTAWIVGIAAVITAGSVLVSQTDSTPQAI